MRMLIIIYAALLVGTSCKQTERPSVEKVILVRLSDNFYVYDHAYQPHLMLRNYIEYNRRNGMKFAQQDSSFTFEEHGKWFGLSSFYLFGQSDSIGQMIDRTFLNNAYDTFYLDNEKHFETFSVLIYQIGDTSRQILYNPQFLPRELFLLDSLLHATSISLPSTKTGPFLPDSLFLDFVRAFMSDLPARGMPPPVQIKHVEILLEKPD